MPTPHLLVIGGGFAGVAAAVSLRTHGADVTLIDNRPTLGGRARSDVLDGVMVDTGAQFVASSFGRTLRLINRARASSGARAASADAAGVPAGLHATPGRDLLVREGVPHVLQYGSVRSLLGFGGLGAMEKMKLGAYLLPLLARYRGDLAATADEVPASVDHESARTFVASRVDDRSADVLVEPPLNSFYATRGSEASLAFFLMLGRYGTESALLAPIAGWSDLLTGALGDVAYIADTRIVSLDLPDAGGVLARAADGREWGGAGAVVATGPRTARELLAPHLVAHAPMLEWLGSVPLRPSWTLALVLDVPLRRDVFGVFPDVRTARTVSACAIYGTKLGHTAPTERDVVLAWPTPDCAERLAGASSGVVTAAMLPEIEAVLPEVRGHVTRARLYRFDEGTPIASPGFAAHRARGRELADQLPLPIALAGDYLTAPLIEGAVASGERAAARLLDVVRTGV
ncbi:MAG TPA: FAD-dependent oxidoreductase [Gemmatimonadaceae bacterium]